MNDKADGQDDKVDRQGEKVDGECLTSHFGLVLEAYLSAWLGHVPPSEDHHQAELGGLLSRQ
jgi:hypothetical protein